MLGRLLVRGIVSQVHFEGSSQKDVKKVLLLGKVLRCARKVLTSMSEIKRISLVNESENLQQHDD